MTRTFKSKQDLVVHLTSDPALTAELLSRLPEHIGEVGDEEVKEAAVFINCIEELNFYRPQWPGNGAYYLCLAYHCFQCQIGSSRNPDDAQLKTLDAKCVEHYVSNVVGLLTG